MLPSARYGLRAASLGENMRTTYLESEVSVMVWGRLFLPWALWGLEKTGPNPNKLVHICLPSFFAGQNHPDVLKHVSIRHPIFGENQNCS